MSNNQESALVPVAGFSQQGQVDWVAMGNSVFAMSYSILQRFADTGIQPLTHHAGLAIATQFKLGEKGNERIRDALDNLRVSYGFESVLWFGFGHRSFLRLLTERELGVNCAALCACLGETYGTPKAAELLQALWEVNDFPTDKQPSRSQFIALVSGCSGLFLPTPFADVVKRMAGSSNRRFDRFASPDLAATINGLFQVSRGRLKAIEIHGGLDIAFLSAVAYWLLDLTIWVQMHDGSVLFNNCSHSDEAAVRLHYTERVDPRPGSLIHISATTFVLRSVDELFTVDPYASIIFRVKWENCLTQMFGHEVKRIQDQASLFGKALGAIARIYEAIAKCAVDVGGFSRIHFVNFQPRGYGRSFVNSIGTILPEIGSHQAFIDGAEQSLSQTVSKSVTTIYDLLVQLKTGCRCYICEREPYNSEHQICDVAILLFLRRIGDIMAHVDIDSPITPTVDGLNKVAISQRDLWSDAARRSDGLTTQDTHRTIWLAMAVGIPCIGNSRQSTRKRQSTGVLLDSILDQVSQLFIGKEHPIEFDDEQRMIRTRPHCTALSRDGICIWLHALRSANADPSSMCTIHVVPGQISYKARPYDSVWDLYRPIEKRGGPEMPEAEFATLGVSKNLPTQVSMSRLGLQAVITERGTERTIGFAFQVKGRSDLGCLQPGILTEALLVSTGLFPCSKTPDCSNELPVSSYLRKSGWSFPQDIHTRFRDGIRFNDGVAFFFWAANDPLSKLLAIEGSRKHAGITNPSGVRFSILLLDSGQCMACLARYWQNSENILITEHLASTGQSRIAPNVAPEFYIHVV